MRQVCELSIYAVLLLAWSVTPLLSDIQRLNFIPDYHVPSNTWTHGQLLETNFSASNLLAASDHHHRHDLLCVRRLL